MGILDLQKGFVAAMNNIIQDTIVCFSYLRNDSIGAFNLLRKILLPFQSVSYNAFDVSTQYFWS